MGSLHIMVSNTRCNPYSIIAMQCTVVLISVFDGCQSLMKLWVSAKRQHRKFDGHIDPVIMEKYLPFIMYCDKKKNWRSGLFAISYFS